MSTSHFRPDTLRYGGMLVIRRRQRYQSVTKHQTELARANLPAGIQQPAQMWQVSVARAGRHARNRCWRFPGGHDFIEKGRSYVLCLEAMTSSSSSARVADILQARRKSQSTGGCRAAIVTVQLDAMGMRAVYVSYLAVGLCTRRFVVDCQLSPASFFDRRISVPRVMTMAIATTAAEIVKARVSRDIVN